jgi:hypothetical protein
LKTKTFDWRFFHIFEKTCQAKAVYGFTSEEKLGDKYLSIKVGFGLEGFRDTTIKQIIQSLQNLNSFLFLKSIMLL